MRIIFSILFITLLVDAFSQKAPKYSNEFLALGVGARSLAMANANVASINDVHATYWNPSALSKISSDMQIGAMHAEYFAGIAKYDYLGITRKLDEDKVLGISMIRFGVDDIPNTLELIDSDGNIRYDRIKSFSVADYSFMFSYGALSPIENLRYGGNVKVIRRIAGEFADAWGFGIDASAHYILNDWQFGAMLRDVTTTFNAWSFNTGELEEVFTLTGNEIPENSLELTLPKLIIGAAREFPIKEKFSVLAEIDFDISTDGKRNVLIKGDPFSIDPHLGAELSYEKMIFFRFGFGNFQKVPDFEGKDEFTFQPNLGIGVHIDRLSVDYAYTDIGDQSIALYSHIFSLKYSIDKK
jgi:hypothetical protein